MPDIGDLIARARRHYGLRDDAPDSELLRALLADRHIRDLVERKVRPKRSRKKPASESKRPPEALVELAQAFDEFAAREKADRSKKRRPTAEEIRKRFLKIFRDRFPVLTKSDGKALNPETLARLCRDGRTYATWPRFKIKGELRIVHPLQAAALAIECASTPETAKLRGELLDLRPDRRGDPERAGEILAKLEKISKSR